MKKTQRLLALLLALLMTLSLAACGGQANTPAEDDNAADTPAETRVFTDSTGREVTVPAQIDKVAVSGPLAQIVLFALCPDKLVGVANEWDESAQQYLDEKYYNLPLLGQLYGGKGELNLETLLSSGAQVVIDVGEAKSTIVEDMNDLQEQTGIPFLHIDAKLVSMDETYTMLGDLLGMTDEARTLADYCRSTYDKATAIADGAEKANLLYITGDTGLNVIARGSYHAEVIDLLSNNLAVVDEPSSKGTGNEVDMEQILNWNPDVILFAPGSIYATGNGIGCRRFHFGVRHFLRFEIFHPVFFRRLLMKIFIFQTGTHGIFHIIDQLDPEYTQAFMRIKKHLRCPLDTKQQQRDKSRHPEPFRRHTIIPRQKAENPRPCCDQSRKIKPQILPCLQGNPYKTIMIKIPVHEILHVMYTDMQFIVGLKL